MRFFALSQFFLYLSLGFSSLYGYGQLSKVHYIPPIAVSYLENSRPFEQYLYISTPSNQEVAYVIKPIGQDKSNYEYGTVSNAVPAVFGSSYPNVYAQTNDTPFVIPESLGATILKDRGYIIEAERPVYVSVRFQSSAQAGAIVSKGTAGLSTSFVFGGFVNDVTPTTTTPFFSFFSVMATEDNTLIEVNFPKGVTMLNYSGAFPLSIRLQKNESYVGILRAPDDPNNYDGLIGGTLKADKNVVVLSGSTTGTNGPGEGHDYGIDQLVGTEKAGDEFIFIRGESPASYNETENIILVPLNPNTTYSINGGGATTITGAYAIIEGTQYSTQQNMYVQASGPVMAFQGVGADRGGGDPEPNQGMFVVPALNCSAKGSINNIPFINKIGPQTHQGGLGIVAEKGEDVLVNGALLAGGQDVYGNNKYVTYRISGLTSDLYRVESNGELYVSYFTYSGPSTSGAYYSGFQSAPDFTFDLGLTALGTCVENDLTLNATNVNTLDSYNWWYNATTSADSSQWVEIAAHANNPSYRPTQPGWYQLRGVLSCGTASSINSQAVFVGNCPDDNDNDGVVDNLDLDKDNDGILNSVESGGNITVDLSDLLAPGLPAVTDKNVALPSSYQLTGTVTTAAGNTMSGDANGILSSYVAASVDSANSYTLTFSVPSTVVITLLDDFLTFADDEFVTIRTSGGNNTISLVNIEGTALVDTNYDDAFETGVDYYTSTQIKLRANPNAPNPGQNVFVHGYGITELTITHSLNNIGEDGAFNANIYIENYPINTDSARADNIPDYLDLDSDGDGCVDVIEAGFEDPDGDGMVGISPIFYDPNTATSSADEFGRVVFAGYDPTAVPADNDSNGVFDFQQAGTAAVLSQDLSVSQLVICEGETVAFSLSSPDGDDVFWDVDMDGDGIFESADGLGFAAKNGADFSFTINAISSTLDQASFRARVNKKTYSCTTDSQAIRLTVKALPEKPNLNPLTIVCAEAVVSDLNVPNVVWYENAAGGAALTDGTLLEHNKLYYAAQINNGCESKLRSETKVVINDPIISASTGSGSVCAGSPITLSLDTSKILPSPDDFARMNDLVYIENAAGPVSYENGYYYTQKNIKEGVPPITWLDAKSLGESIVGATLYIINSEAEESAVFQGLAYMGLTGNDGIAFWLGLFQDPAASSYSEPAGGWFWVDGTPLNYENWFAGEPNDYGGEDYGQFEYGDNLMQWNDMSLTKAEGQSYPLFEYKAQTQIEWFSENGSGYVPVPGAKNSSQLVVSPTQSTSYIAKVTTNGVPCFSAPLTITIDPLPVANDVSTSPLELCVDDNNGGVLADDLRGDFDLTNIYPSILGTQDANTHLVSFFTSLDAAENESSTGRISTPERFTNTTNPQTVYYRVTNTVTSCVSPVNKVALLAIGRPPLISIDDIVACDDLVSGSDEDGVLTFDLADEATKIEAILGSTTKYSISYHLTELKALGNLNPIRSYTTTPADNYSKEIVVRVEDTTTGCVQVGNRMRLIVNRLPKIKQDSFTREQCATDIDGIVQDDLTLYNVYFSEGYLNESFAYYTDPSLSEVSKISDPTAYKNLASDGVTPILNQTIYLKITNSNGCERTTDPSTNSPLTLNINVGASVINDGFFENYYACPDKDDPLNANKAIFDKGVFSDLEAKLIAAHPVFGNSAVNIQFFESEIDAATKNNPIDLRVDYINTTPNSQEIWAAIDTEGLNEISCLGLKHVANLIVEPLPTLSPVVIPRQCDGDSPLDLNSQDGSYPFDTSTLISQIFAAQDPSKVNVYFYDTSDSLIATNSFPAVFNSPSQTIRAVVENKPSNVIPPCYQEAFIDFVVDDSPEVGAANVLPLCDDTDGVIDGKAIFDTSELNANLLAGQTNMTLTFLTRDSTGNEVNLGGSLPNPFTTETTTIIAQIYNSTNPNCMLEEPVVFQVYENPVFDLPQEQVYCVNLGSDVIYTTNAKDPYTYSWKRNGAPLTQTTKHINISQGGVYEVTASSPLSGCATSKTVEVMESEIPLFSFEDVRVFDLTGNGKNRIEISSSDLGIGDYEFSFNLGPYQDNGVFENVSPGIFPVRVRDKNGCGVVQLDVSVIGYPYFFTPNNDGTNDRWQLLGVSNVFQSDSAIYIFDRHGRLLAQVAADGAGWDGMYNGNPLPADDYWFRAKLEDGRSFTGHFSLVR